MTQRNENCRTHHSGPLRCLGWAPFVALVLWALSGNAADLGLLGTPQAAGFLRRLGVEFLPIGEDAAADVDALLTHRAIVCDTNHRLTGQDRFGALTRYVKAGGRLFVTYSRSEELGGCTFEAPSGWGLWGRLRSESAAFDHIQPGEWLSSPCYDNSSRILQTTGTRPQDTYGLIRILPDTEVLLQAELSRPEGDSGRLVPGKQKSVCPWLVRRRMGRGVVYYGMYGVFRYLELSRAADGRDPVIEGVLRTVLEDLLRARVRADLKSAALQMDLNDADADYRKTIYLNGTAVGAVPVFSEWPNWKNGVTIPLPESALSSVARRNDLMVTNEDGDPFKIRNVRLDVVMADGKRLRSDLHEDVLCAFRPGWPGLEGELSAQATMPLPMVSLTLPDDLGVVEQPRFSYATFYGGDGRPLKVWNGLDSVGADSAGRTLAFVNRSVFENFPAEKMAKRLRRYNAGRVATITHTTDLHEKRDVYERQINACRQAGFKVVLMLSPRETPYLARIRGTVENQAFMTMISDWATKVDTIGLDEWYFSPSRATTQGAREQGFTEGFLTLFQQAAGLSREDAQWGLSHCTAADPRAKACWEFSRRIANEFVGDLVTAAKGAAPEVTTIVSYITRNWNRYVAAVDDAIHHFDEILDCQTYWYGGLADDPLDASKTTGVLGLGKVYEAEWPGKFTWLGFAPGYAGGDRRMMKRKRWYKPNPLYSFHAYYENSPQEVVPYLALQYAVSEGVFIFTLFNSAARGKGHDEDFADVVRLVSRLVPNLKGDLRKGRTALYYAPDKAWEIYRQNKIERYYLKRQELRKVTGFLEQFLDIEVTDQLDGFRNVIIPAPLFPGGNQLEGKGVYVFGAPLLAADTVELTSKQLRGMFGVSGFIPVPDGVYDVQGDVNAPGTTLLSCWAMEGVERGIRQAHVDGHSYPITADHDNGRVRITSLTPYGLRQRTVRSLIKEDLNALGWLERDCPQVNGNRQIVAVAFREPRQAVIDFGENRYSGVSLLVFNGSDGILRNEEMAYEQGVRIDLAPFQVLVATGIAR